MKNLLMTLTLSSVLVFSQQAKGEKLSPYIENSLIDVCKVSLTDKRYAFKKTLKSYRLKMKTVARKLVCNGTDIADFAEQHGAHKIAKSLNDSLGKVTISDIAKVNAEKIYVNF